MVEEKNYRVIVPNLVWGQYAAETLEYLSKHFSADRAKQIHTAIFPWSTH